MVTVPTLPSMTSGLNCCRTSMVITSVLFREWPGKRCKLLDCAPLPFDLLLWETTKPLGDFLIVNPGLC